MQELLKLSLRKTSVGDLEQKLIDLVKQYRFGGKDTSKYQNDIKTVCESRKSICVLDTDIESLSKLNIYYNMVKQMNTIFEKTNTDIQFIWTETLTKKQTTYVSSNFLFELQNVLYNIGCVYSSLGLDGLNKNDTRSIIQSCKYFQQAAQCFDSLKKIGDKFLDSQTIDSIVNVMRGQAQEMVWLKSVKDEKLGNKIVGRLAYQVSVYYANSLRLSDKTAVLTNEWSGNIYSRSKYFEAVAYYRTALDVQDENMGLKIKNLVHSLHCIGQCKENNKGSDDVLVFETVLKDLLKHCQRENDFSYMSDIPLTLTEIVPLDMVKLLKLDHYDFPRVFDGLPPLKLVKKAEAYNEMEKEYIFSNLVKIGEESVNNLLKAIPKDLIQNLNIELPASEEDYNYIEKMLINGLPQRRETLIDKVSFSKAKCANKKQESDLQMLLCYLRQGREVDENGLRNLGSIDKKVLLNFVNVNVYINPVVMSIENEIVHRKTKIQELQRLNPGFLSHFFENAEISQNKQIDKLYATYLKATYTSYIQMVQEWLKNNRNLITGLGDLHVSEISNNAYAVLQAFKANLNNFIKIQQQVAKGLQFYKDIETRLDEVTSGH